MEESVTKQLLKEGDKLRADGIVLECTFVSWQERVLESGEVEKYNFTYSFRPHDDMERERTETAPPASSDAEAPTSTPDNSETNTEGQAY